KLLYDPTRPPTPIDLAQRQPGSPLTLMADYLSPELAAPGRAPDSLTDLYALGCTLYAMLAGASPFAGGDAQQKLVRHATEAIRPLEPLGIPRPLAQVVTYMMAKNPAVRYQSAQAVAEQLAMFVDPAAMRPQIPAPAPTLISFEQLIRQKQMQSIATS